MTEPQSFRSSHTPQIVQCRECPAGNMHLHHITYFTWLGEELVTVQNFPAWICDMCGKREYDERAISWLTMLLNPSAGKSTRRVKRPPQPDTPKRNLSHPLRD
jgi:YgiT-type zinc finger domain-containing protein